MIEVLLYLFRDSNMLSFVQCSIADTVLESLKSILQLMLFFSP